MNKINYHEEQLRQKMSEIMKKGLLCLLQLTIPLLIFAAKKGVLITHNDQTTTFLSLEKEIKVEFIDGKTLRFSETGVNGTVLNVSDVDKFQIAEYDNTSTIKDAYRNVLITISEVSITLSGLSDRQSVVLYDTRGVARCQSIANAHGKSHINIEKLPKGAYVLSLSNGKTYKILKR